MTPTISRVVRDCLASSGSTLQTHVERAIDSIERRNGTLNALVSVTQKDAVVSRAADIQKRIEQGTAGALAGAILSLKDAYAQKGEPLTCASGILRGFRSPYDATVVQRLLDADAIIIGRANMDEFAMGSSNEHSIYGPCRNPLDEECVPGGSSGGSAASIAAGFCNTSLGSDTGGSVRQPASYCGVVGLKPTYGRVSRYGLVAYASSFDCVGPMAGCVEDVARLLSVIAGADPHDQTSASTPVQDYAALMQEEMGSIRFGVPREYFSEGLDEGVREVIQARIDDLKASGHQIVPISMPHTDLALSTYYILATAEASSNLARYDGVRYGLRPEGVESLDDVYVQSRTQGFGDEVKRRILLGTYVLSKGYYDAYYGKAQRVRRLIQQDFTNAFSQVDMILSPTSPTTAFPLGQKISDPLQMYLNDVYTLPANLAGVCAISLPAGRHANGLPVGVQLQAAPYQEARLLQAARLLESLAEGEARG